MVATYNGSQVIVMESTAFQTNGGCLKVDVYKTGECENGNAPIENPICFEELIFTSEKEKDRARKSLIRALQPKKAKKTSRPTNGCIKKR